LPFLPSDDRCSRREEQDRTGPFIAEWVRDHWEAEVTAQAIVPDERPLIADQLRAWSQAGIDLILTTGGTGFSPRDVTPEATQDVIERDAPGLPEAMRAAGLAKTPNAMLSRAKSRHRAAHPHRQPAGQPQRRAWTAWKRWKRLCRTAAASSKACRSRTVRRWLKPPANTGSAFLTHWRVHKEIGF
jgi:molybdenum cofactor synthesis domain-containing protein